MYHIDLPLCTPYLLCCLNDPNLVSCYQNFGFVLHLFGENVLLPEKSGQLAQQQQQILEKPPGEAVPAKSSIIIVPNSSISCLSLLNAVDFLCHGKFVSSEEKKNLGAIREAIVTFKRRDEATGEKKYFKIVDNPALIAPEDWDRVVAVFVSGQAWQFKGWKWSNPVDLFRNVLGIYLTFDERPIDPNVMTWNCKILKVSKARFFLLYSIAYFLIFSMCILDQTV